MARINFIVPRLKRKTFSGGIQCIMEYARGLSRRGHSVTVIPALPSPAPEWFPSEAFKIIHSTHGKRVTHSFGLFASMTLNALKHGTKHADFIHSLHAFTNSVALIEPYLFSYEIKKALMLAYLKNSIPDADITVATAFETALPCSIYGKGKLFYFAQHYEPFFKNDLTDPYLAEREALISYQLGLNIITNSTWLKNKLSETFPNLKTQLCLNAIDHEVYFAKTPAPKQPDSTISIISYGGRKAAWKGFHDIAEAMRITREALPHMNIRWLVYGDASLPPSNPITPYESLGFLQPRELAEAYRGADILLSASWYESFPLFPLEAMACGLAVITTQAGTEDYAKHGVTAEIVAPRNPKSIAAGLIRLIQDPDYRHKLATNGAAAAREFTWEKAVSRMEELLLSN